MGRSRSQRVFETWSSDKGLTWSPVTLTSLPNPSAGTDAVTLRDGRHLIVYNHTPKGRSPLNVAVSRDGKVWESALVLESEPGEYSYPAVFKRTVDWAVENGITTATFHIQTPYPGTGLHARLAREGRLTTDDWDLYDTRHLVFRPARLSGGDDGGLNTVSAESRFGTLQLTPPAPQLVTSPSSLEKTVSL